MGVQRAAPDPYVSAHLLELATRGAIEGGQACFSRFLDPAGIKLARAAAKRADCGLTLFGGFPDSERVIAAFHPFGDVPDERMFPIAFLRMTWEVRYANVGHRDLLGALMALGLEREVFGDLLALEGQACLALAADTASFVAAGLESAGRARLKVAFMDNAPPLPPPKTVSRHDTVASLRLDALIAAAFHLSRQDAGQAIRNGRVRVDHEEILAPDTQLQEGALISMRGEGRVRLLEVGSLNRKGRIGITLLFFA